MSSDQQNIQGLLNTENQPAEDLSATLGAGQESEFVVSSDEKKPMGQQFLYLLLLIVIGGGVTFYMYKRQGPSAAAAATAETARAKQTINSFLTQPDGVKGMQALLKNTEKVVQQFNDYPSVKQVPLQDLQTNPFRSQTAAAPKPVDPNADAEAAARKREQEKAAANKAFSELSLQMIAFGTHPACMINNTQYRVGQQIDQFTIESIKKDRVILKSGPYEFTLINH